MQVQSSSCAGANESFLVSNADKLNEKLFYSKEFLRSLKVGTERNVSLSDVNLPEEPIDHAKLDLLSETTSKSATKSLILPHSASQQPNSLFNFPFSTHYLGAAMKVVTHEHADAFPLLILAKLLRSLYLHGQIREKGGAYGAGCSYSLNTGIFSFYSYRDPTPLSSVQTISACANWLSTAQITHQDLLLNLQSFPNGIPRRTLMQRESISNSKVFPMSSCRECVTACFLFPSVN